MYTLVGLVFILVAVTFNIVIKSNCIKMANTKSVMANRIV